VLQRLTLCMETGKGGQKCGVDVHDRGWKGVQQNL
jgi:hypothetical protein